MSRPGSSDGRPIVNAVRNAWRQIQPYSTGGNYVTFQLAEDADERTAAAYGANFERLRWVKAAYDPDNLFRSNRNISPRRPAEEPRSTTADESDLRRSVCDR